MQRVRRAIMVVATMLATCAIVVSSEENSAMPLAKISDLKAVQFLFAEVSGHYCSTDWQSMKSLREALDKSIDVGRLEHYLPKPASLPRDVEDISLAELGQERGDWFIGYNMKADALLLLRLSGVALEPSGDGGYSGFLVRFEGSPEVVPEDSSRPIGVCFPIDEVLDGGRIQALVKSTQVERDREAEIAVKVREYFGSDVAIKSLKNISDSPRRPLYVGETLKTDNSIALFALTVKSGKLMPIPFFNPKNDSEQPALLLEDADPDNDVAMYDSTYSYLADMDENDLPELFVRSTVSYFFALEEASGSLQWRMVNTYYRALVSG